jgi:hypothetical protein
MWIAIVGGILLVGLAVVVVLQRFQPAASSTQVVAPMPIANDRDSDGVDDVNDYYPDDAGR